MQTPPDDVARLIPNLPDIKGVRQSFIASSPANIPHHTQHGRPSIPRQRPCHPYLSRFVRGPSRRRHGRKGEGADGMHDRWLLLP